MSDTSTLNGVWRIWTQVSPRAALIATGGGLFALALLIHFTLLNSTRFNWLDGTVHSNPVQLLPPTIK